MKARSFDRSLTPGARSVALQASGDRRRCGRVVVSLVSGRRIGRSRARRPVCLIGGVSAVAVSTCGGCDGERCNGCGDRLVHNRHRTQFCDQIRAYTLGGAFACFAEDRRGSITPGKQADLVMLSEDLFDLEAEPRRILNVRVLKTIVGGEVVYSAA